MIWPFWRRRPRLRAKIEKGKGGKFGATIYGPDGRPLFVTAINARYVSKCGAINALSVVSRSEIEIIRGPDPD